MSTATSCRRFLLEQLPRLLVDDAVVGESVHALEVLDGGFGDGSEVAVDRTQPNAFVLEMGDEPFLEEPDVVAFVAALEVGSSHRDRLLQASAVLSSS